MNLTVFIPSFQDVKRRQRLNGAAQDSLSERDVPDSDSVVLRGGISINTGTGRGSKPFSRSSTNIASVIAPHSARVLFSPSDVWNTNPSRVRSLCHPKTQG